MKLSSLFTKKTNKSSYSCPCCGEIYNEVPLCFGAEFPDFYFSVPPEERDARVELTSSLCVVDKEYFFHRGRLTIPIIDHQQDFYFDIWTSISADNFALRMDLWESEDRINQEPYFGWLQTNVPTYGETLNIKSIAIEQAVGIIPEIQIAEKEHPLAIDQENGITYKRALEMVEKILRKQHQLK